MIIVCIRTFIVYLVILFTLRIMGKSELSKMSTFQMVILFMIAELASIPIDSPSVSLINGIVAIITLLFLEVLLSYLSIKHEKFKNLINGKPSIIIDQGMINVKEMRRLRITINDLFEQLRIEDCPSLNEVDYAVMESNGELSIIQKNEQKKLPLILISDGVIYETNLKKIKLTSKELYRILQSKGITQIKQVFVAFYDENQQIHVYPVPSRNHAFSKEVVS